MQLQCLNWIACVMLKDAVFNIISKKNSFEFQFIADYKLISIIHYIEGFSLVTW